MSKYIKCPPTRISASQHWRSVVDEALILHEERGLCMPGCGILAWRLKRSVSCVYDNNRDQQLNVLSKASYGDHTTGNKYLKKNIQIFNPSGNITRDFRRTRVQLHQNGHRIGSSILDSCKIESGSRFVSGASLIAL